MASLNLELIRKEEGRALLGESPVWDPETGDIWWVDVTGKKLFRLDGGSRDVVRWNTPECPGFVVLTAPCRPAVGMQTGIYVFDPQRTNFDLLVSFEKAGHRFNDATVDQLGRLWTSTMALDAETGVAAVHMVSEDLVLEPLVQGLTIPNGLAVDLERGRLFYCDSHRDVQSIWFRDLKPGYAETGREMLFATTKALKGRPDGAALDVRGFYWIAGVDGAELYVFSPDGQLGRSTPLPFPAPTKLAFFGPGGRSIAITSKAIGEDGGYMALADMPEAFNSGITQPYWTAGA